MEVDRINKQIDIGGGWGFGGEQLSDWELRKLKICLFIRKVKGLVYALFI